MSAEPENPIKLKSLLRGRAKKARAQAFREQVGAPVRAAANFLSAFQVAGGHVVSAYRPIRDEMDPTPLMEALSKKGAQLCVPVIEGAALPLSFRAWTPEATMIKGAFGAEIPEAGETLTPALLIMPLLAFDRKGGRLGYGGGHFDRTLQKLRSVAETQAVGLAYAAQEMPDLPQEATDQPLDAVVTESEAIFFPR